MANILYSRKQEFSTYEKVLPEKLRKSKLERFGQYKIVKGKLQKTKSIPPLDLIQSDPQLILDWIDFSAKNGFILCQIFHIFSKQYHYSRIY